MSEIDRRQLLGALGAAALLHPGAGSSRAETIHAENDLPGTLDWQLTYTRVDPKTKWRSPLIEGYAGRQSVQAGDKLELFVSTDPPAPFVIDLYRLGYYQGKGGRFLRRLGPFAGKAQPTPPGQSAGISSVLHGSH